MPARLATGARGLHGRFRIARALPYQRPRLIVDSSILQAVVIGAFEGVAFVAAVIVAVWRVARKVDLAIHRITVMERHEAEHHRIAQAAAEAGRLERQAIHNRITHNATDIAEVKGQLKTLNGAGKH